LAIRQACQQYLGSWNLGFDIASHRIASHPSSQRNTNTASPALCEFESNPSDCVCHRIIVRWAGPLIVPEFVVIAIMSSPPTAYPPYQPHRNSQSFDPNTPPAPPPKPSSQEVSRRSTPAGSQPLPPPPPPQDASGTYGARAEDPQFSQEQARIRDVAYAQHIQDPGEHWLPKVLEDKRSVTLPTSINLLLTLPTVNKILPKR
jgi:hypothetical protein